ncbi:hypothetical protein SAMN05216553_10979 [Lentzea fradiae]|uniref:Uncharacterized protein n=1 Tax=Lentzea fradiae TaxID=200378 RepID=A0A1G7V8J2_9PSEU|nr:DUF5980 family protein [Lentzea fradiae]SDG56083.1 hypothetical protein SAMN05216553_10979 [Lentzea fradiae]
MRITYRLATSMLSLAAVFLLTLAGSPVTASAQTSSETPAWNLTQWQKTLRMCVQAGQREHGSYFIYQVTGTWKSLRAGMSDLPPGWSSVEYEIGSSDHFVRPDGSTKYFGIMPAEGPASVPLGTYSAHIWVTDGTVTQTTPADIVVTTEDWVDCMN